ncbi:MAG: purine-binding chemotaxis protein CheW [Phycisphaerales bacterium]|nr:MAG: purine-binding chemotaxis protein CheW [Phycisphaerales bacterium]
MTQATAQTEQLNKAIMEKEGKYLTFALGPEEYGLEILKVREIIGYMDITAVPQTPAHVKGVINLRGQVIPVIDLRAKFGMETTDVTEQTCIIVVETSRGNRNFSTGIVVDRVQEVLDIAGENIEQAPQFGSSVNTDFILGMGKIAESVKILLDIDEVLSKVDLAASQYADQSQRGQNVQSKSEPIQQVGPRPEPSQTESAPDESADNVS